MLMRGKSQPDTSIIDTVNYEAYKIQISQIGLQYFANFPVYERHRAVIVSIGGLSPNRKGMKNSNREEEQIRLSVTEQKQTLQRFDVLDDFEINIMAKTKKKIDKVDLLEESEKAQFMKLPKVSLCIDTSQINIRLSHSIYNNIFNLKHIFEISK